MIKTDAWANDRNLFACRNVSDDSIVEKAYTKMKVWLPL